MKKISAILLSITMLLSLAACGSNNTAANDDQTSGSTVQEEQTENNDSDSTVLTETAGVETTANVESDGYDKFSQLKIGMTESEVNAILGEPTKVDKAYYYYNVIVNGEDMELTVWINTVSGLVTYISGEFNAEEYRTAFADQATDLSAVSGLESGEISTYDDCVSTFKTPGYLMSIDEDGVTRYLWVNTDNGYMSVTFKADGSVKTYGGFC